MSERIRTQADLSRAVDHLRRADAILAQVITEQTSYRVYRKRSSFESLVRIILGQQLSTAAARTIYERVTCLFNGSGISPESMSDVTDQQFLDAGVSRAKLRTMRSLSDEIISKELSLRRLSRQSDEIVFEQLTRIKGIGPWSVQMYQMFVLGSPDIFPESDTGILNAMNRLYRSKRGNAADIASQWSPYRTVACWYLWRYLDSARNGVE